MITKDTLQSAIMWMHQSVQSFEGEAEPSENQGKDVLCELISALYNTEWNEDGEPSGIEDRQVLVRCKTERDRLTARVTELEGLLTKARVEHESALSNLRDCGKELEQAHRAKRNAEERGKAYERSADENGKLVAALRADLRDAQASISSVNGKLAIARVERKQALYAEALVRRDLGGTVAVLKTQLESQATELRELRMRNRDMLRPGSCD